MNFRVTMRLALACTTATTHALAGDLPAQPAAGKSATKVKVVGVEEFDKLRANKTNIVLDVRTPAEFKAGHIPGATNVDYNSPDFAQKIAALDKDKTYLVHCAAGSRSARACKKLEALGFQRLYDLHPGFNGWQAAGKAVEK
jgi:rhodanese-related sulfurtransferase